MEKYHLEISEEVGIYTGSTKTRKPILNMMEEEEVTIEEAEKLWEFVTDIRLETKEQEVFDRGIEQCKREAKPRGRTELLECLERDLNKRVLGHKEESCKLSKARDKFLADYEESCGKHEVS